MDHVGKLLHRILKQRGLKEQADASLVLHESRLWLARHLPQFGDALSPSALLPDGTLLIEATHSTAAQECQHLLPHLLHHLREDYGHVPLQSIRVIRTRSSVPGGK